jgi:cyclophilin family peptidyl-prolyl cis-trans isomerase
MISRRAALMAAAGIVLLSGCSVSRSGDALPPSTTSTPTGTTVSAPPSGSGPSGCSYRAEPSDPAPPGKDVGLPSGTEPTVGSVALRTNQGEIKVAFSGTAAPCTVRSFAHLAEKKFFDNTSCHRLTLTDGLKVLQCGDPTGSGSGGPGYTIPDENPTDLKAGTPGQDGTQTVVYSRGTVAMANTGQPHSGGSQFFVVYGDSILPPVYAVFGTVDAASLAVLDKIAAAGIESAGSSGDGAPKSPVTIQQAVLGT